MFNKTLTVLAGVGATYDRARSKRASTDAEGVRDAVPRGSRAGSRSDRPCDGVGQHQAVEVEPDAADGVRAGAHCLRTRGAQRRHAGLLQKSQVLRGRLATTQSDCEKT